MAKTTSKTYNGLSINAGPNKPCDTAILERLDKDLQYMLSKYSRVLEKRSDLHYPEDGSISPNPRDIYRLNDNLRRELTRNNPLPKEGKKRSSGRKGSPASHQVDPLISWVKERATGNPHPHYHIDILVNGNAIKSGWSIQKRIEKQWANVLGLDKAHGLVNNCNQSGPDSILIDKSSPNFAEQVNKATYRRSYLAKTKDKDRSKGENRYGGTRVPKNKG